MNNEIASSASLERARQRQAEMRAAIDAKCFDCEGGDAYPHVQWRIGNCVYPDCPLYAVRPHQRFFGTDLTATSSANP